MSTKETQATLPLDWFIKVDNKAQLFDNLVWDNVIDLDDLKAYDKAQLLDNLVWDNVIDLDDLKAYEKATGYQISIEELYGPWELEE